MMVRNGLNIDGKIWVYLFLDSAHGDYICDPKYMFFEGLKKGMNGYQS